MSIIETSSIFLQTVSDQVPRKVRGLLAFGYKAISLQQIQSLNSNARSVLGNRKTAESKAWRLGRSALLRRSFAQLVGILRLVKAGDVIAVDFSDFGIVQVLMFAKQTRAGRALPVFFTVLPKKWTKEKSQNLFVNESIDSFCKLLDGAQVSFVFDRGFACPAIIKHLIVKQLIFYIRIKSSKHVEDSHGKHAVREFPAGARTVTAYGHQLRLAVSPEPAVSLKTKGKAKEAWYIITNDMESSAEQIIEIYYHRFEIEEVFKDAKRLFGLEYIKFKKAESLTVTLWFVILGTWLHYRLETLLPDKPTAIQRNKKGLVQSRTHYWVEQIRRTFWDMGFQQITPCVRGGV